MRDTFAQASLDGSDSLEPDKPRPRASAAAGRQNPAHAVPVRQRSPGKTELGDHITPFICSRGVSPLSWGRFLMERQRFPPGATSASEMGSEKAEFGRREAGRAAGAARRGAVREGARRLRSHLGEAGEVGDAAGVVHVACQEDVALVAPLLAPAVGSNGRA